MDEKPQELKLDMGIYGIFMLFRRGCLAITELMLNGPWTFCDKLMACFCSIYFANFALDFPLVMTRWALLFWKIRKAGKSILRVWCREHDGDVPCVIKCMALEVFYLLFERTWEECLKSLNLPSSFKSDRSVFKLAIALADSVPIQGCKSVSNWTSSSSQCWTTSLETTSASGIWSFWARTGIRLKISSSTPNNRLT